MSRPQSEAEYLASLLPSSVAGTQFGRRALFRGALGVAAAGSLAACGGDDSNSATDTKSATGVVTFGSNQSDEVPKAAYAKVTDQFHTANPKLTVKTNTVDHNTFQEQINSYLQGSPDDVFTWFSGFRMRFFAAKGLAGDISDIWPDLKGFSDALKTASTGDDGKQYFVPFTNYPWAIFYRKSVFADKGYQVPKTLDDLVALSKQMQKDKLAPIAFGDKDGWPAMGTFDQLNMRINGFQFHMDLMAGKKPWNGPEVKKVFDTWARPAALPPGRLARPHLAGGGAVAAAEEVRHVRAGHVRRAAVPQGRRAGRPGLLHLPGDRLRPSARTPSRPRSTAS